MHAAHSKPKTRSLLFCASSGSRVIMSLRAGIVHKATMTLAPFFFLVKGIAHLLKTLVQPTVRLISIETPSDWGAFISTSVGVNDVNLVA